MVKLAKVKVADRNPTEVLDLARSLRQIADSMVQQTQEVTP
jgi:hypothetical protein